MWGCVSFWVEANTFTVWDWGIALPSELKQIRLLIEYVGMRSLLSGSRFVSWLGLRGFVTFWDEENSFADWVCVDAFYFRWKQIRLLIEIDEIRYLLRWRKFVCWLSMWGCVPFWVEACSFADWVCGDVIPFKLKQFRLLIEYVGMR